MNVFVVMSAIDEENQTAIAAFDNKKAARHMAKFVCGGDVVELEVKSIDNTPEVIVIKAKFNPVMGWTAYKDAIWNTEDLFKYKNKIALEDCSINIHFKDRIWLEIGINIDIKFLADDWDEQLIKYGEILLTKAKDLLNEGESEQQIEKNLTEQIEKHLYYFNEKGNENHEQN